MKKLVIFGGTFDPIHNGHLAIAKAASLILNAKVIFVPAKSPRWKKTQANPEDRLEMLKIAIKEDKNNSFDLDTFEMDSNNEINYSIDTVKYFKHKYEDYKLYFLIGADQVNQFPRWKEAKSIIKYADIIYVGRPSNIIDESIVDQFNMIRLPYDELHKVSSSDVRDLKCNDIPDGVRKYIEDKHLYYINKISKYLTDKRLYHSISVASLALRIAEANKVENYKNAYIAGLLHDIGKYVNLEESRKIMSLHYPEYINLSPEIYHQFVGTYLIEKDFDIHNEDILEAVKWHTTGKQHASAIAKIVYCSDKIEPTRGFDSKELIDACIKNYYVGFLEVLRANFIYFKEHHVELDELVSKPFYTLYCGADIWTK